MAKSKAEPEPAPAPKATGAASVLAWLKLRRRKRDNAQANKGKGKGDGTRETFESIAVAFLAAFMFRTFLAEAFVIPTGSMAPTLFGRHKDVECPECGTLFQVGASDEVRPPSGNQVEERNWLSGLPVSGSAFLYPKHRLLTSFCPNCRTEINVKDLPVFTGDRILVNKWPFEFSDPDRWDVVVFKYPEEPQTNYIKRLVGLPGEQIEIERGDVYARDEDGVRTILRKHPGKQRDLRLPVYDDTKPPVALLKAGWPERWQGLEQDDDARSGWAKGGDGWSLDAESRSYRLAAGDDRRWLRYRHFVPTPDDWELLPDVEQPTPKLVTDFLAYNTYTGGAMAGFGPDAVVDGRYWSGYWVGDLALDAHVEVESAAGELVLELNEGFRRYRATVDLATGEATVGYLEEGLDRDEPVETTLATATTRMRSPGTYRVEFANVDQRLDLWIDGSLVTFDGETTYSPSPLPGPARGDLSPAGIAVTGTAATVDRLKLYRDVYYRAEEVGELGGHARSEASDAELERLALANDDPDAWADVYNERTRVVTFDRLADDEFFMLGDNSARSQDSRLWPNGMIPALQRERRHAVPRSALVGKAFFVYWPHGVPFLNDGKGFSGWAKPIPGLNRFFWHREVRVENEFGPGPPRVEVKLSEDYPLRGVPFYPQFQRMQRIR